MTPSERINKFTEGLIAIAEEGQKEFFICLPTDLRTSLEKMLREASEGGVEYNLKGGTNGVYQNSHDIMSFHSSGVTIHFSNYV